ncbi:hypothetical protein KGA65_07685 [Ideonella sp. B7]|uniref:hypothetical protein n=1 Tax=Ideonella benzenivorans TaxID=2831643 RepID=UPI001CED2CEE|nr:hypothetical protein [Ideonella benzenivorans]MCA6216418.1 hypothetical protein [Ideonella benzenivorans]
MAKGREVIRLGQSAPISGAAQHLGIEYQRGLQLAIQAASGGPAPEYVSLEGWAAGWDAGGLVLQWDAQRRQAVSVVAMTVLDREGRPIR